jgi:hypothetical protein
MSAITILEILYIYVKVMVCNIMFGGYKYFSYIPYGVCLLFIFVIE